MDVLFPKTKGWMAARPGEIKPLKAARAARRGQARHKLHYWISLGKPLVKLARQHGSGILGAFPKKMCDTLGVDAFSPVELKGSANESAFITSKQMNWIFSTIISLLCTLI
jgi:hypothetical protein